VAEGLGKETFFENHSLVLQALHSYSLPSTHRGGLVCDTPTSITLPSTTVLHLAILVLVPLLLLFVLGARQCSFVLWNALRKCYLSPCS